MPSLSPACASRLLTLFLTALILSGISPASDAVERYEIDPAHTSASFEYDHWGLALQRARFDRSSGFVTLDPAANTGAIQVVIETASISTGSAAFDVLLRSRDYFDADQHPYIRFIATSLEFSGQRLVRAAGDLTMHGITRPVTFELTHFNCRFMFMIGKRTCGANGYAKILRSDFDLGRYTPFVRDEVTLFFSVEAIKRNN